MKMVFQRVNGAVIEDTVKYIQEYIKNDMYGCDLEIMVGCDSLPKGNNFAEYSTVICLYRRGKGAHVIFNRETKVKVYGMKDRLWGEVIRCVEVSSFLADSGILDNPKVVQFDVHLDFNKRETERSNIVHDEAVGYVRAMGFDVYTKPDAPAASFISDHLCRHKEKTYAHAQHAHAIS